MGATKTEYSGISGLKILTGFKRADTRVCPYENLGMSISELDRMDEGGDMTRILLCGAKVKRESREIRERSQPL